mgnify:FL=1|jgi:hypothetical protein
MQVNIKTLIDDVHGLELEQQTDIQVTGLGSY